jgi:hypothetical protein
MKIRQISQLLSKSNLLSPLQNLTNSDPTVYKPTPYLAHPFLQSIYNIS